MNSLLRLIITTLAITVVFSKRIYTGPQASNERTAEIQKSPNRYEAEEVVVYLTPSQLQAIREGKGFIDSQPPTPVESDQGNEDGAEDQLEEDDSSQLESNEPNTQTTEEVEEKAASSLPEEELNSEEIVDEPQFSWIYRSPKQNNIINLPDDLYTFLSNYPELEKQSAEAQSESKENIEDTKEESEGSRPDTIQKQRFKLVPYESATETNKPSTTELPSNEQIREHWLRLLEKNRIQLKNALLEQDIATTTTTTTTTTTEQPEAKSESTLTKIRYSAKYRSKNQRNQNKDQRSNNILEQQKELNKGVARANDVVRKEVKTANQQQKSSVKQVRVHTPVFIPVPESPKIPIYSPIPFMGLKPVSLQANKSETKNTRVEEKKPESQVRARGTELKARPPKNLSVGTNNTYVVQSRPSTDAEKKIPAVINLRQKGKPGRITIIRHVFEN